MEITLTPELLKSQAGQMEQLMGQYDSLFSNVTSTLNTVNNNWSENLSNNFASKIISAQKSFSGILDTLQYGANAASTSAESFLDIDAQLAKVLGGNSTSIGSSGIVHGGEGRSFGSEGAQASILEYIKSNTIQSYKDAQGSANELEEWYNSLPKSVRKNIEKILGDETTAVIKIAFDIIQGEASLDTLKTYLSTIKMDKTKSSALVKILDLVINRGGKAGELLNGSDYYQMLATEEMKNGNYAEGIKNFGLAYGSGLLGIGYGSIDILSELALDVVSTAGKKVLGTLGRTTQILLGENGEMINVGLENLNTFLNQGIQWLRDVI